MLIFKYTINKIVFRFKMIVESYRTFALSIDFPSEINILIFFSHNKEVEGDELINLEWKRN